MLEHKANSICGTSEYLAPEVFQGKGYSFACDWWSFGCLLYEMLTGLPPFYYKSKNELYNAILTKEPVFKSFISSEARDLLLKLLQKDPLYRI